MTIIPDNTSTIISYGFCTDREGSTRFSTTVTDAANHTQVIYEK